MIPASSVFQFDWLLHVPALAQSGGTFWLPSSSSTTAGIVDRVFYLILGISAFFFLLIVTLMVVFVIRYRRREKVTGRKEKGTGTFFRNGKRCLSPFPFPLTSYRQNINNTPPRISTVKMPPRRMIFTAAGP